MAEFSLAACPRPGTDHHPDGLPNRLREGHSGHFHVIVPEAQQVEIASSPKWRIRPCSKQHRPFKHEAVTRCCPGKAIQQPFDAVADEQAWKS
jgi:hypothetical protein